ncbi:ribonuclease-like [Carettochelys insculpta]|uniref:ribonuclease-like n=1 Tax=Carettochelys insculpta TaxID=44489 RepID=UPI003EBAEFDF
MAPGGLFPLLLLPLVLLGAGLAQLTAPQSYWKFVAEHVDFPRTRPPPGQGYCDLVMERLSWMLSICKLSHTFLHASSRKLRSVCHPLAGICNRQECDSRRPISLTTCQLRSTPRPHRCLYTGVPQRRRVRLECRGGRPVRFIRVL